VRRRIGPGVTKGGRRGEVFFPERLVPKLARFLSWKRTNGQALEPAAPLFVSAQGRRLSPRAAQWRFAWWQARAGVDRRYCFHRFVIRP
jgi:site-specific recombinase XerC